MTLVSEVTTTKLATKRQPLAEEGAEGEVEVEGAERAAEGVVVMKSAAMAMVVAVATIVGQEVQRRRVDEEEVLEGAEAEELHLPMLTDSNIRSRSLSPANSVLDLAYFAVSRPLCVRLIVSDVETGVQ